MNDNEKLLLNKLASLVGKQQKIIAKLAQALPPDSLPTSGATVTPGHAAPGAAPPPPMHLAPNKARKDPAVLILQKLPINIRSLLMGSQVEVHGNNVTALAKPDQPDHTLDAIQSTVTQVVTHLAENNVLPPGQYNVQVRG
jgi:hypothetical protein